MPPQNSTRPVANLEMQMEPPPLPNAKVVIPTTQVSSAVLELCSTSQKGKKKKKTKRTLESHNTMQVTPQPLQTSNSFDVLVGLTEIEISAPTTGVDNHPIAASPYIVLHCFPLVITTHLAYPPLLPPSLNPHFVDLPPPHSLLHSPPIVFHLPSPLPPL